MAGRKNVVASYKNQMICDDLQPLWQQDPTAHFLIFTSRDQEQVELQEELMNRSIPALLYNGSMTQANKQNAISNFEHSGVRVLIINCLCGNVGINLQIASFVYLASPSWNPSRDVQAIRRSYRKGQTKEVTVTRVFVKDSIEEFIIWKQLEKFEMISETLGEADDDSHSNNIDEEILVPVTELYKLFRSDLPVPVLPEGVESTPVKKKKRRLL